MRTERRCIQRKRPGGISYFEFEAGSGGIVLDASEKGLGFQAADVVHQLGPSRIWISPHPEERIELTGDVVWTDRSRKTGGLRFMEAGTDSRRKIRNWLGQPEELEESRQPEGFPLPAWATQALGDLRDEDRQDASIPRPTAVPRARAEVEERPMEVHSVPGLPSIFTSKTHWLTQDSQTSDGRAAYRIATGFLIVVLAVAGILVFDMFRPNVGESLVHKVGESLIHLGERINGSTKSQPLNTATQPGAAQSKEQTGPNNDAKPDAVQTDEKPVLALKGTQGNSALPVDASKQASTQNSDTGISRTEPATKEAPNRPADRGAKNWRQDRSAEATRLWSAVASGDSSAEVDLARLYVRGEGVPRNCIQAKVLLRAAAKGGSAEARQELRKLQSSGCR